MQVRYIRIFILAIFLILQATRGASQLYKFGVRAGVDFSTINGETEMYETHSFNQGFHFGMSMARVLTPNFGFQLEIMYAQKGFVKEYHGPGYYPIRDLDQNLYYFPADVNYVLEMNNSYISMPIGIYGKFFEKFELGGGVAASFLINPRGGGTVDVVNTDEPDRLFFRQNLSYNYYSNIEGGFTSATVNPQVYVGDDVVTVPSSVGAYYFLNRPANAETQKRATQGMSWFDISTYVYARYFINKSFYFSLRGEYGFIDISKEAADFSLEKLSSTNTLKFNRDTDLNVNIQASVGFSF